MEQIADGIYQSEVAHIWEKLDDASQRLLLRRPRLLIQVVLLLAINETAFSATDAAHL